MTRGVHKSVRRLSLDVNNDSTRSIATVEKFLCPPLCVFARGSVSVYVGYPLVVSAYLSLISILVFVRFR